MISSGTVFSAFLFGISLLCYDVAAWTSACTPDFVEGTCVCKLADGSGTIDLTEYAELTKTKPFSNKSPDGTFVYDFSLCNPLTSHPEFYSCYGYASICQYFDWTQTGYRALGRANTTRFEMRTASGVPKPKLALVTIYNNYASFDNAKSVAFLTCNPSLKEPAFYPADYKGEKDGDGGEFKLYSFNLEGAGFCPKPDSGVCKPIADGNKCVCDFADGAGKIDLTPLVQQSAVIPFTAGNGKFNYSFAFCGTIKDSRWPICDKHAAVCEYSSTWNYNMDLGEPGTFRFERRVNDKHPKPTIALVADASDIDGTFRRSIAFLNCKPDQPTVTFESYGYHGVLDVDDYQLYYMDFTGAAFCPV